MSRHCVPAALLLAALMTSLSAPADAQPSSAAPQAQTEDPDELYRKGNDAYNAGSFQEAYELYSRAYARKQSYDIVCNLSQAEAKLGKFAEAANHLVRCRAMYPANGKPEGKAKIASLLAELQQKVGSVRVKASEPGAAIYVDGKRIDPSLEGEIFLSPGPHTIEAKKDGFECKPEQPKVSAGMVVDVPLSLVPKKDGDGGGGGAGGGDPVANEPRPTWPGWLLGGVGLVGLGVGAGLLGVGLTNRSSADDLADEINAAGGSCPGHASCAALEDELGSVGTFEKSGAAVLAVGGAALLAGIIYLAVPDEAAASDDSPESKAGSNARVWICPFGAGISGQF